MPADFAGLDPTAQQNLMAALDELRRNRIRFNVTSAYRSPERQAQLYADRATNPYPVAPPGHSDHERGRAADLVLADESQRDAANRILAKYGWSQPLPERDRVHYAFGRQRSQTPTAYGQSPVDMAKQFSRALGDQLDEAVGAVLPDIAPAPPKPAPNAADLAKQFSAALTPEQHADQFSAALGGPQRHNPHVQLGPHGRVVDPVTGQEFGRPGQAPHATAEMTVGQRVLEHAPQVAAGARDLAFKALSFPFDPLTAYMNDISAHAMAGERDPALGPYLGPLVAAGEAAVTTAPGAAVRGLVTPHPVKPDFFTPPGFDAPGRPGGVDVPISPKADRYLREGANLAASIFAVDPASSAAYAPALSATGRGTLALADKAGLLDRKLPLVDQTVRQMREGAAGAGKANQAFIRGEAWATKATKAGAGTAEEAAKVGRSDALAAIAQTPGIASRTQVEGTVLLSGSRYGPLAGHYVAPAVQRIVDANVGRLPSRAWQGLLEKAATKFAGTVKGLWTTGNGPILAFNFLNNRMLAESEAAISKAGHFTEGDIISGAKQLMEHTRTGKASPAVQGLQDYSRAFSAHSGPIEETAGFLGAVGPVGRGAKAVLNAPRKAMEFTRQATKVGLMTKLLKAGYAPEEAARRVERALIDYKNTDETAATLDRLGIVPFARHIVEGSKTVGRTLATHPDIPLRYSGLRLGQAIAGAEGGDVQQEWQPGQIPVPSFLPGSRDALGRPTMVSGNLLTLNPFAKAEHGVQGLFGGGVYSGIIDITRNQNAFTGQPIVPPGTPPEDARRLQFEYLTSAYAPPLTPMIGRGYRRIEAAAKGVPLTHGRTTEAQPLGESLAQSLLGVKVTHAEPFQAKQERLAPVIDRRAATAGQFVDAMDQALANGSGGFPEHDKYRGLVAGWKPFAVRKALGDVRARLKAKLTDPTLFDRNGKLTDDGRAQLRRMVTLLHVVGERLDALPQQ